MENKIIFLWTCSRCISTAFERAVIERKDCKIFHEPFSIPYYFGNEKKSSRFELVKDISFDNIYNSIFNGNLTDKYLFIKDMAYYLDFILHNPLITFPKFIDNNVKHSFLIRHPQKSIKSLYLKSCIDNHKTKWNYFDENEAGFKSIYKLWKFLNKNNIKVIIIDADDLLNDPINMMKLYFKNMDMTNKENTYIWDKRKIVEFDIWPGWHDDVLESTGLKQKNKDNKLPNIDDLPDNVKNIINESIPLYEEMYKYRTILNISNYEIGI